MHPVVLEVFELAFYQVQDHYLLDQEYRAIVDLLRFP